MMNEETDQTAVGSLWNQNSWHWEEKNYTANATQSLRDALTSLTLVLPNGPEKKKPRIEVKLDNIEMRGEVCLTVRKQKKLVSYEIDIHCEWESTNAEPSSYNGRKGKITIPELCPGGVEDDDFAVTISSNSSDDIDTQCLDLMQTYGLPTIRSQIKQWALGIGDEELNKVDEDKRRREAEHEAMLIATQVKGALKESLLYEQNEKDEQNYLKKLNLDAVTPSYSTGAVTPMHSAQPKAAVTPGSGSVWNTHSYHWEEKQMTCWARETLEERLSEAQIPLLGGECTTKLFECKVTGDASAAIRKGMKLVIFDLTLRGSWSATRRDVKSGTFLADAKGVFEILEFSSESFEDDEYEVKVKCDNDNGPRESISKAMKSEGVDGIKALLTQFVADLRLKG